MLQSPRPASTMTGLCMCEAGMQENYQCPPYTWVRREYKNVINQEFGHVVAIQMLQFCFVLFWLFSSFSARLPAPATTIEAVFEIIGTEEVMGSVFYLHTFVQLFLTCKPTLNYESFLPFDLMHIV